MAVYTDSVSSDVENRDIDIPRHTFGVVDQDQGDYQKDQAYLMTLERVHMYHIKTCKCEPNAVCVHAHVYYYLFKDLVYMCLQKRWISSYATNPPTVESDTTLDLVPDPGSMKDVLLSRPPSVKGMLF